MKKYFLFTIWLFSSIWNRYAQGNYQISGKISGVPDGTLLLVRNDGAVADTIATTLLKNGTFMLKGKVEGPVGAYVTTADGALSFPVIVEPTNIMVNLTASGALIQGGEQQELFAAYNRIGQTFATEQSMIQAEAQQPGANLDALQKRIDNAYQVSVNKTMELIKTNPNAYATAYVISLGVRDETEESLRTKYDLLGENAKNSVPGKQIANALRRFEELAIGKTAPDFSITRPNGDALSLYGTPTQNKLLVFWASWDVKSREVNTELIQLYQQFRPKSFEIISISLDDNRFAWDRAIEQDGISIWSNGSDLKGWDSPVAKLYMVGRTLPYTVLIDGENKIVAKGLLGTDLRKAIADLTKKNKRK